ncbi:hypothetical protein [Halegenticoccus tardaugens]|uniref:hypothetical protein n=1 Tax=Halegenticoccus tardaugens TaxID=2071624 RepID=UPI00100A4E88|nr:hypothetical protein [Halegenticoccus tardaugens]
MGLRGAVSHVWNGLRGSYDDPFWWRERACEFLVGPIHANLYPGRGDAVRVVDEDWDTLVVLDACRADLFAERADLRAYDEYRTVESLGSTTREWVRRNFAGGTFGDVVYVTANPYVSREAGDAFHRLYEPWIDAFDGDLRTVPPEAVVEAARRAHEEHPDKRVVVHFMQPHHPFVGERDLRFSGWRIEGEGHGEPTETHGRPYTPWDALWMGAVDRDDLWLAYGDNLTLALDAVSDLLSEIDGRVVVTSDHGNMLGERTFPLPIHVYGHPKGVRSRELVEVPWAVVDAGPRRTVRAGDVRSGSESERSDLEERLADLGYV